MAAANSASSNAQAMQYAKSSFDTVIEGIALANPEFKALVPFLKAFGADLFSTGQDPNAQVLKKLDEIEAKIQEAEDSIKRNTYDVVSLQAIGDKYNNVADLNQTVQRKIGNIMGNNKLSQAQKLQQVADLMNANEFSNLETAVDGATRCFTSNVNDIFQRQSIFEAAYARACGTVMFSSEAIDISMPYIIRQYAVYLAGYAVMNQVYDAYEQVYGVGTITASRNDQLQRLGGVDAQGNKVDGMVGEKVKEYLTRDRFIFVNKGSCAVKLDRGIVVTKIRKDKDFNDRDAFKAECASIPLSSDQIKQICEYGVHKFGVPVNDFLFHIMDFVPVADGSQKIGSNPASVLDSGYKFAVEYYKEGGYWRGFNGLNGLVASGLSTEHHNNGVDYIRVDIYRDARSGSKMYDSQRILFLAKYSGGGWEGEQDWDLFIFQSR